MKPGCPPVNIIYLCDFVPEELANFYGLWGSQYAAQTSLRQDFGRFNLWQCSENFFPVLFPSHNVCVQFILINFQVQLFRHQGEETALMETSSEMKQYTKSGWSFSLPLVSSFYFRRCIRQFHGSCKYSKPFICMLG